MQTLKRNQILITFGIIFLIGLAIHYLAGVKSLLWDFWGAVDVSFAVALGVLAFMAYREMIKSEDEVKIYFEVEGKKLDTGLSLLRRDCTRSEINGILPMVLSDGIKFHALKFMKNRELLQRLHKIQKGKLDELLMPMSAEEFEQFTLVG